MLRVLCHSLGATPTGDRPFHPFFHEVVEVEQSPDPDERPTIVAEHWPGHLLDAMLLLRTGVTVRAGTRWLVRGVADRSALYWACRRRARPTRDLSMGWGRNSQWTTPFRRDYHVDGVLHFNIDEAVLGTSRDPDDLSPHDLTALLRYRSSTVVDHGDDQFPYDAHHTEPAP